MSSYLAYSYSRVNNCSKNQQPSSKNVNLITTLAGLFPTTIDSNGVCYDLIFQPDTGTTTLIETLYQTKLPSFKVFQKTQTVVLNQNDFNTLIGSHHSYINDVVQITGKSYDQVMLDFANYHQTKAFVIQPKGLSDVIHKVSNSIFVSGAAVQSAFATATSHISGVTGLPLLCSVPGLIIFVPLVGGVFFASVERLAANTPAQGALIIARDVCLLTPKITEIAYNEVFVGPFLRMVGIDAPLNVTSMLRFGNGTQKVLGSALNATISTVLKASPINMNLLP